MVFFWFFRWAIFHSNPFYVTKICLYRLYLILLYYLLFSSESSIECSLLWKGILWIIHDVCFLHQEYSCTILWLWYTINIYLYHWKISGGFIRGIILVISNLHWYQLIYWTYPPIFCIFNRDALVTTLMIK